MCLLPQHGFLLSPLLTLQFSFTSKFYARDQHQSMSFNPGPGIMFGIVVLRALFLCCTALCVLLGQFFSVDGVSERSVAVGFLSLTGSNLGRS